MKHPWSLGSEFGIWRPLKFAEQLSIAKAANGIFTQLTPEANQRRSRKIANIPLFTRVLTLSKDLFRVVRKEYVF